VTYSVRSATVRFGPAVALDDVTVEVPGGSVVAVVGGDGAGKSTLLRALAGEVSLDAARWKRRRSSAWATSPRPGQLGRADRDAEHRLRRGHLRLAGDELAARRTDLLDRAALTARGRPARRAAVRRDAPQARLRHGDRAPAGPADPRRAHHGHRPGEPHRPVAARSEAAASGAAVLMSTTYLDEAERAAHLVVLDRGRVLVQGSYDQVRADFAGVITRTDQPVRAEWAWRRGRVLHEYWPDADPSAEAAVVAPDLEDIVIALSLARRDAVRS
jgi:ABC-type multidrug transport system, ATPase component